MYLYAQRSITYTRTQEQPTVDERLNDRHAHVCTVDGAL